MQCNCSAEPGDERESADGGGGVLLGCAEVGADEGGGDAVERCREENALGDRGGPSGKSAVVVGDDKVEKVLEGGETEAGSEAEDHAIEGVAEPAGSVDDEEWKRLAELLAERLREELVEVVEM